MHRELYAEHAELYGENVASKIELCLAGHRRGVRGGRRARASATASSSRRRWTASTCSSRRRCRSSRRRAGQDERELRRQLTLLTWPFNVLGAPALAIPCGPAEDGLPASVQIVGRPGDDALVLGAGALLESLLKR